MTSNEEGINENRHRDRMTIDEAMEELKDIRGDDTSLPFEVAQALDMGIAALKEWIKCEIILNDVKGKSRPFGEGCVVKRDLTIEAAETWINSHLEKVRRGEWET